MTKIISTYSELNRVYDNSMSNNLKVHGVTTEKSFATMIPFQNTTGIFIISTAIITVVITQYILNILGNKALA